MKLTKYIELDQYFGYDYSDWIFDKLNIDWIENPVLLNTLYSAHSGEKLVTPLVLKVNGNSDKATTTGKKNLADLIKAKYLTQWNRVYDALTADYNLLNNYNITEIEGINLNRKGNNSTTNSGNNLTTDSITDTYNLTNTKNNTETRDLTETTENTQNNTNSTTKTNSGSSDAERGVYAYDSSSLKPADKTTESHNETDNINGEDNTTSTGNNTDKGTITDNGTDKQTGTKGTERTTTNNNSNTISSEETAEDITNRNLTKTGNTGALSPQYMINKELELRVKNLYDIMFKDLDSLLTMRIYYEGD